MRNTIALFSAVTLILSSHVFAQEVDLDDLIAQIDERSGKYAKLVNILQGDDPVRAIAAFDVMVGSGEPSLAEIAVNAGLISTDTRLRGRALWEAVSRKDVLTINLEYEDLTDTQNAYMEQYPGELFALPVLEKFRETQCLNFSQQGSCYPYDGASVSGIKLDVNKSSRPKVIGSFVLTSEGTLKGQVTVTDIGRTASFDARVDFR